MSRQEVREQLFGLADAKFKIFNDKIINCSVAPSMGVRVPKLREIARRLAKDGWQEYLEEMENVVPGVDLFQEEHMLQGMVIGCARMSDEDRVRHLEFWIPGILSWGDCDCCVSGFKFMKKNQDFWFDYNTSWLSGNRKDCAATTYVTDHAEHLADEFCIRYALVSLMQYFINDTYIDRVMEIFATSFEKPGIDTPYYIKMAQAWALSVSFVKYRDRTLQLLEQQTLEPWVQNKAIQKCRESYRVSPEDKVLLKALKV